MIKTNEYPELHLIARKYCDGQISEEDAFLIYQREWRCVDVNLMTDKEKDLITKLVTEYGNGTFVHKFWNRHEEIPLNKLFNE